jgi:hypothetical protein
MAFITQQTVAVTGGTLTAAIWNNEFQNIINNFNGGIDNANIANAAGIAYSKLALTGAIQNNDLAGSIAPTKITGTALTQNGPTINKPIVNGSVQTLTTLTYAGTINIDLALSNHFYVNLSGAPVFTISNGVTGQCFLLHIMSNGNSLTWFGGIKWAGGVLPTLTATPGKIDTFGFIINGADIYGYIVGKNI